MKNLITIINLSIIIGITSIFTQSDKIGEETKKRDSQSTAGENVSKSKAEDNTIKSDFATWSTLSAGKSASGNAVVDFIREMTEARIMDLEQGKIAEQRASNRPLKDYGSLMVNHQSKMLDELKKIAELKDVSAPTWLGSDKVEALEDLRGVHGTTFDKRFIRMMIIDHKRDVKILERATAYGDADIQVFATKYLPVVQSHLDRIKALKKSN